MHILIIEDDLLMALDIEACLERMGLRSSDFASSEDNALKLAGLRRPDLIISDVRLAQGNGPEAVRRIRAHHGFIPCIYVTGNPDVARAADPDAGIIVKPMNWPDLTDIVSAIALVPERLAS